MQQQQIKGGALCGATYMLPGDDSAFGPQFVSATIFATQNIPLTLQATADEVRNGFPMTSYVARADAVRLPPQFGICSSSAGY